MKIASVWKALILTAATVVAMTVSLGAIAAYPTSFQTISFYDSTVNVTAASGTTGLGVTADNVSTPGASYRSDYQTYWITQTNAPGIDITFTASAPTLVLLNMRIAYVINSGATLDYSQLQISINNESLTSGSVKVTNDQWHQLVVELPIDKVNAGSNTVTLSLADKSAPLFVQSVQLMPRNIYAQNGVINTALFAQFGATSQVTGAKAADAAGIEGTTIYPTIWTRAYGLEETTEMIPAPTFFYKAGDLLQVNLVNKLNTKAFADNKNKYLREFENSEAANLGPNQDETLANLSDQVRQEVNIPHNLNNTNLHVHGLHVDPEKDDVTIVIVPDEEGGTVAQYDAPPALPTTPEELMCTLDEGSVSDQPVKPGNWPYVYRLPENHLPGTHWFHPHKHGSTAAQLENGMAGSMVIQEPKELAIFPDHLDDEWSQRYDRVMMIQQIANYGLQQGTGSNKKISGGQNQTSKPQPGGFKPDTVINGKHRPTYRLPPAQIVRWRFVNAGANHQAFNHLWLAKNTGKLDSGGNPIYQSQTMWAVGFDGITTDQLVPISADKPLLLAPGNRADVLIQVPANSIDTDEYAVFKYYPNDISIVASEFDYATASSDEIADHLVWDCSAYSSANQNCSYGSDVAPLMPAFQPVTNPYLFATNNKNVPDSNGVYSENFAGFTQPWINISTTSSPSTQASTNVAPLIKLQDNNGTLDIDFALAGDFPKASDCTGATCTKGLGEWQPALDGFGGGQVTSEKLLTIKVDVNLMVTGPSALPTDQYLSTIAVTGNFSSGKTTPGFDGEIPAYVSPFSERDLLQSRPVIFDKSGAAIVVTANNQQGKKVNQFTLNGRPFALNDMIGNSLNTVNTRLADTVSIAELKRVDTSHSASVSAPDSNECTKTEETSCLDIEESLSFVHSAGANVWSNGVCKSGDCSTTGLDYYWANPGYFQPLKYHSDINAFGYIADKDKAPDWSALSGLATTAVLNPDNKYGTVSGNVNGVPGLPVATTAEEWVFVNNSDIGHPFHIHINPFFVLEIGQLSYETFKDKAQWVMRAVSSTDNLATCDNSKNAPVAATLCSTQSNVPDFVGNWWDTVIVPPHGYVRMRYWMNVPDQTETTKPDGNVEIKVTDNDNKIGVWVYHCHILRHEDRGMMMPVITQQLTDSAPGPIQCPAGMVLKKVKGAHH